MDLKQKILNAIDNDRLKLIEWKKNWYKYIVSIQKLVWTRNLRDGYNIDIFDSSWCFLERIELD